MSPTLRRATRANPDVESQDVVMEDVRKAGEDDNPEQTTEREKATDGIEEGGIATRRKRGRPPGASTQKPIKPVTASKRKGRSSKKRVLETDDVEPEPMELFTEEILPEDGAEADANQQAKSQLEDDLHEKLSSGGDETGELRNVLGPESSASINVQPPTPTTPRPPASPQAISTTTTTTTIVSVAASPDPSSLSLLRNLPVMLSPTLPPVSERHVEEFSPVSDLEVRNADDGDEEVEEVGGVVSQRRSSKDITSIPAPSPSLKVELPRVPASSTHFFTEDAYDRYSINSVRQVFERKRKAAIPTTSAARTVIPSAASSSTTLATSAATTSAALRKGDVDFIGGLLESITAQGGKEKESVGPGDDAESTVRNGATSGSAKQSPQKSAPNIFMPKIIKPISSAASVTVSTPSPSQPAPITSSSPRTSIPAAPLDMIIALASINGDNGQPSLPDMQQYQQYQQETPHSRLTKEEHLKFLQMEELLKTNPSLVSEVDRATHQRHIIILAEEREAFREWQRERMKESDKLNVLNESIERQIKQYLEVERRRILEQYPRYYEFHHTVSVSVSAPGPKEPILTHKATLLRVGSWCCCKVPNLAEPIKISQDRKYWSTSPMNAIGITNGEKAEPGSEIDEKDETTYWRKKIPPVVSKDFQIHLLLAQHDIHVVISSGGLSAIVDLQSSLDTEWEIPVMVTAKDEGKGTRLGGAGDRSKTIFIDKPLPRKRMTPRDCNQKFYDTAFKSMCLDYEGRSDVNDTRILSGKTSSNEKDSVEDAVQPEISAAASFPPPIGSSIRSPILQPTVVTESIPDITMRDADAEQTKQPPFDGENLTYTLWSFGELNVLVRYRADGYIPEAGSDGKLLSRTIGIKTKLEYQLKEGWWEETTAAERARAWIYSYIRGHAHILVARLNVLGNEVVRVERRQMIDIFEGTKCLTPGAYLVSHKKGDWNATVYKSTAASPSSTSTSIYDLHETHHNPPVLDTDTTSAFVPAWGGPKEQVPWTFAPVALQSRKGVVSQGEKATGLRYCFQFADTGTCSKTDCSFKHVPGDQVDVSNRFSSENCPTPSSAASGKVTKRKKKKKKEQDAGDSPIYAPSHDWHDMDHGGDMDNGRAGGDDFEMLLNKHEGGDAQ
ncbi:hypothetical protein BC937DRAFT_87358 [Endogone sp. FLAS-F59071]|nr:hypothetical protein BC937DRAFT_87358 [Endogone sp. FLAS-F59071]|eukprot:RUS19519.1 hypothetical protein BC937DRAFT_87358 [Endogone sp. FLAS-F59071]